MEGEEITANLDACSSIMCKNSVILEYHMETPNMALANRQNGNSGLERSFAKSGSESQNICLVFMASLF